ncbi:hypothetical protein [Corallococcus sp. AB038B]|uniref:hypothetical protein n=1 Tax=Corallococcus sp. AB038B TaxID=2316718 RepID=UPI001F1DCE0A|nr:hypothetical protein [Corallococcus sp. AB038B]
MCVVAQDPAHQLLSANIELPTDGDLKKLAPEKSFAVTGGTMKEISARVEQSRAERQESPKAPKFAPAGQSTQMIVGATSTPDAAILDTANRLYTRFKLKRVYYSGYSPIPLVDARLPAKSPPLVREHRLYQADWLLRFYGFRVEELTPPEQPDLSLELDPKLAWALRRRELFPVDVNRAPRESLLRVPGMGVRTVDRILRIRRWHRVTLADLGRLRVPLTRMKPFIVTADHRPTGLIDSARLAERVTPAATQLSLFTSAREALTGEL